MCMMGIPRVREKEKEREKRGRKGKKVLKNNGKECPKFVRKKTSHQKISKLQTG